MQLARIFLVLFFFSITATVSAQPGKNNPSATQSNIGKLTGRLVDEQKKPVAYATVVLVKRDSNIANGSLTDDAGEFTIEPTGTGSFKLRISGIGINQQEIPGIKITPNEPEKNLGNITVATNAQALGTVEVVAERAVVEMNIDKKVFNVEKNTTATGGSAADVLQNVPSVQVDGEGNVSLRGKSGVNILIDGKPATLLGSDVASALQSMPASSIANIEVITNPSAKYDAQGMTGIINIITKKDKKLGFNGNATAGIGTRDKYNGSLGLNLKNDKWNFFLNSSFRANKNYHRFTTDRSNYFNDSTYYSYENNNRDFKGFFNSIGVEYTIDNRNTVTLTQNLNIMRFGGYTETDFYSYDGGVPYDHQNRYAKRSGGPFSSSTAINYKHKFANPGQEITADLTYAKTWSEHDQEYTTNYYNGSDEIINRPLFQRAPSTGGNSSFNGQIDYTMPFISKTGKLDAGVKAQLYRFESSNDPVLDSGRGPEPDVLLLNDYEYTQDIHAGYVSFSDQAGKWSYQGGLRLEYAGYEGTTLAANGKRFTNDYLSLFPSAYVSYKLPKEQTMYLNYSRRTDRPSFWRLMPYYDLSNPQDTNMGNPNLVPEFIHNVELNYNKQFKKGHNLIVSTYYQYTQNLIERIRKFYDNGTSFTQPQNVSSAVTYGVELIGRAYILPIWDATLSVNFFNNTVQGQNIDPQLNNSGSSWFAKLNTNIRLPKNFSVQLMGNYEAPKIATQGRLEEVYWVDIGIRKSLWEGKASIVLNVTDIFDTRKYTTLYEYPSYLQTTYRDKETRIGNLSFTYRFGQSDKPTGRKGRQGNNAQEKGRDNLKGDEGGSGDGGGF